MIRLRLAPPESLPLLTFAVLLLAACGDGDGPTQVALEEPIPATLLLETHELKLLSGDTVTLRAVVRDQRGTEMAGQAPSWTSRDPSTASVFPGGALTGLGGGDTWVVAEAAGLRDSVLVRVRYRVGRGQAHVRLRRPGGDMALGGLAPEAFLADLLGTGHRDRTSVEVGWSNGGVSLILPGLPGPGRHDLIRVRPESMTLATTLFDVPAPTGMAWIEVAGDPVLFLGISGYLDVTDVAVPEGSETAGRLAAHVHFQAEGFVPSLTDDLSLVLTPTGDTLTATWDVDVDVDRVSIPYAEVTLSGGPLPQDSVIHPAQAVFAPTNNFGGPPLVDLQVAGQPYISTIILDPQPGTRSVFPQTPDGTFGAGATSVSVRLNSWFPYLRASGTGGTFTLDQVVQPTLGADGELRGHLETSVLYWLDAQGTEEAEGTLSMEFHALWPSATSGSPSAASRAAGDRAWRGLLDKVPTLGPARPPRDGGR
ncbi:MAG: hypothetical protein AMXMBFR53_45410 [Gemmatimonadota bacterium]